MRPRKRTAPASNAVQAVVGLANPGADYLGTRHNVGAEVVEELLRRTSSSLGRGPTRVSAMTSRLGNGQASTLVAIPTVFMNESGRAVAGLANYFKIASDDILIIHDDIDLPFGKLRLQVGGGSGGHNGIKSVESAFGGKEFSRLKVGVGRPPGSQDPADYVLRRFTKSERPEVDLMVSEAADVVDLWLRDREAARLAASNRGSNA